MPKSFDQMTQQQLTGAPAGRLALLGRAQARVVVATLLLLAAWLLIGSHAALAAPGQTNSIVNSAWLFSDGALLASSKVTVNEVERTPAELTFYGYRPESSLAVPIPIQPTEYRTGDSPANNFVNLPSPVDGNTPLPLYEPLPLVPADQLLLHLGEALFMTLDDQDQNLDPERSETVLVTITSSTGDREILRLTETGPNTGVFSGFLQTSAATSPAHDGLLQVEIDGRIDGRYVDIYDGTDTTTDTALVDPLGTVFDSRSGEPVSGVLVRLIDVTTGELATVYGDGGTACPIDQHSQPMLTGGSVTDSCGVNYQFAPGAYRFPLINPGSYRLVLGSLPAGYSAPSTVSDTELQQRDWWQTSYSYLVTAGSRGESFPVDPGPALRIDIPVDPADRDLWLSKEVNRSNAAIGDFLQYQLLVDNSDPDSSLTNVTLVDQLPAGFRYQPGSVRTDGTRATDPDISADGRQLTFTIDSIAAGTTFEITYVVEVTGGARPGEAVNQARAFADGGLASAMARATVVVQNPFWGDTVLLMGRVLSGSCDQDDTELPGLPGVRIYLEDGTSVVTDSQGKYHFEGARPGTHVVQLDTLSLPPGYTLLACEENSQSAGRNFSRFVDLRGGSLWQVNFHARPPDPPVGTIALDLSADRDGTTALLTARAKADQVPAENLHLSVWPPAGFVYEPGSARRDGQPVADPVAEETPVTFDFASLAPGQETTFSFRASWSGQIDSDALQARAELAFDTASETGLRTAPAVTAFELTPGLPAKSRSVRLYPRFPTLVAILQPSDLEMLLQLVEELSGQRYSRVDVVGHTDNVPIAAHNRHLFADNQALSEARAGAVAAFLQEHLNLDANDIHVGGMADRQPIADNSTVEGRALNRRVELSLIAETTAQQPILSVTEPVSPLQSVSVTGQHGPATAQSMQGSQQPKGEPYPKGLLSPRDGQAVSRTEAVRVRLDSKLKVRLTVDGTEVPADRIGFRMTEPDNGTTLYTYIGVDFGSPGTRQLLVEGIDPFGNARFKQEAQLTRTGDIASIRLLDVGENIADGTSPIRIRVELIDEFGRQLQVATNLTLASTELRPLGDELPALDKNLGPVEKVRQVSVDAQGWISFNPVDRSGPYHVALAADGVRLETDIYVKPQMRDWILVGFAEGTIGYNTLRDNRSSAREAGIEDELYTDGQVKFFAKGAIQGKWLLTLAYDSDKPKLDGDSLHQSIDPDRYYPLYGDETRQGHEAASAENLYVKLERGQFYAMFGDMQTGLDKTELSKYVRSLNGFKSELQSRSFDYSVFASESVQSFAKDEIRGDGTSGRYRLSRQALVINSEEVVIETRDRFHNETIIATESLRRYLDYEIDYTDGTLFFKRPIPSRDENFNPVFIVVRYEVKGSNDQNLTYGGRAVARLLDRRLEIGTTLVHEENGEADGDLYGADLSLQVTPQTYIRAEVARTSVTDQAGESHGADAWLAEVVHLGTQTSGRGYIREQQTGFGLGQQSSGQEGMMTYGVDAGYQIDPYWSLAGEMFRQKNQDSHATRDVGQMQVRYQGARYGLMAGLREARDRFEDGTKQTSSQLLAGGDISLGKFRIHGIHEQSLGGSGGDNADYPTRTLLGAEWLLSSRVSLFAEQEFTWGQQVDTQGTRAGFKSTPWAGGSLLSSVQRDLGENGERLLALFGLGQTWQVTPTWSVDFALDRSYTLRNEPASELVNPDSPPASGGDEDFTAVSVGAAYQTEHWAWVNRLESRHGDREDRYGLSTSLVGELRDGLAASARLMAFLTDRENDTRGEEQELTLGLAWRPLQSRWIVLERFDLEIDKDEYTEGNDSESWRIINHLHTSYRPNRQWQSSLYYGLKYVSETIDGATYHGFTDMIALESRYNLTRRVDLGAHGGALHSWNSHQIDYSAGISVGCQVLTNSWVSLGYNVYGFEDDDFSAANYTAEGFYVKLRVKFDQQSVKEAVEGFTR